MKKIQAIKNIQAYKLKESINFKNIVLKKEISDLNLMNLHQQNHIDDLDQSLYMSGEFDARR